ncbi:RecB-like helicase [Helicobacter cetorum]|uniref:DNA 3'-5' helicase n=1 Tax=Helicobacter cetorum (strain ATCC BAA-429 / MIT 00-7128) TaxID=182217 RepID=I0EKD8_HELC0|nr:RecB-like helicase [Helicobacter cetorum]AFI03407.1 putative recombination protein RecB [Helicobacter cetorum MIT 00-7128]
MDTNRQCMALKASAGSGKTFALSVRFLALLFKGANPSEILALTFTKKAAAEMKNRVLNALKDLQNYNKEDKTTTAILETLQSHYALEPTFVLERAKNIYQLFLNADIKVSTIDAFFQSILRKFCWYANLSANFDVNENAKAYQALLDERFLGALNEVQFKELGAFVGRCLSHESYQSQQILELIRSLENRAHLFESFSQAKPSFDEKSLLNKLRNLKDKILAIEEASDSAKKAIKCESLQEFLNSTLTWLQQKGEYRFFKKFRDKVPTLDTECEAIEEELRHYYEVREREFFEIFPKVIKWYKQALRGFQELDFLAIKQKVHALLSLKDENTLSMPAEFFYFRLDSKISHILIDEFQDTSLSDYEILSPFIEEIKSGLGQSKWQRSVFFVGDVKQSIYGFRGSFSSLFEEVSKDFYQDNLEFNYRSSPLVIAYVNQIFEKAYKKFSTTYIPQKCPKETTEPKGYVKVSLVADEKEMLLEQVLCEAKNLLEHNIAPKDITILCATNDNALEIKQYLQEHLSEIHPSTESSASLSQFVESKIIKNALEYALAKEPYKPFYKHSVLKLAGYLHNDVIALPSFEPKKESVASFVWRVMNQFELYEEPAQSCLELAITCQDADEFLEKLEAKEIASLKAQGAQIMTIHKSKGMEFPYVILCERLGRATSHQDKLLEEYDRTELKRLYYRMKNREIVDEAYQKAIEAEKFRKSCEEMNVYYVAFTRARLGLIVVAKNEKDMCKKLGLVSLEEGKIELVDSSEIVPQKESAFINLHAYGKQVQEIEEEQDENYEKNDNQEAINFGIALHKGLEHQYAYNIPQTSVLEYLNYHYGFYALDMNLLKNRLNLFENNLEFQKILKDCKLRGEVVFLNNGVIQRIDALLWDKKQDFFVLDYKSSKNHQQGHIQQVHGYAKFIQSQIPICSVKAGIVYANKELLEILWV